MTDLHSSSRLSEILAIKVRIVYKLFDISALISAPEGNHPTLERMITRMKPLTTTRRTSVTTSTKKMLQKTAVMKKMHFLGILKNLQGPSQIPLLCSGEEPRTLPTVLKVSLRRSLKSKYSGVRLIRSTLDRKF